MTFQMSDSCRDLISLGRRVVDAYGQSVTSGGSAPDLCASWWWSGLIESCLGAKKVWAKVGLYYYDSGTIQILLRLDDTSPSILVYHKLTTGRTKEREDVRYTELTLNLLRRHVVLEALIEAMADV